MKRQELEKFLNKKVTVTLFNYETVTGYLFKTGDEKLKRNLNLYLKKDYYFTSDSKTNIDCNSFLFKCSHVKKIEKHFFEE